jgi:hypothetical protein
VQFFVFGLPLVSARIKMHVKVFVALKKNLDPLIAMHRNAGVPIFHAQKLSEVSVVGNSLTHESPFSSKCWYWTNCHCVIIVEKYYPNLPIKFNHGKSCYLQKLLEF